ncbi:MAG TPA: hypothetical protein VHC69_20685 [Polyangiaceae bacterium]|nr:hypothetical protein [Polyangiaceae bacterium]
MGIPRQRVSRVTKALLGLLILVVPGITFFLLHKYFLAVATLLILTVAYIVYFLGMSSGLPGTSGRQGRNVRT